MTRWSLELVYIVLNLESGQMPTELFFELDAEKRDRIFSVCLSEFSTYGFTNASTNRMARDAGISKGSLFKYFESKEELYFHILDVVISDFTSCMESIVPDLPSELFESFIVYSRAELDWFIANQEKYLLILKASAREDSEIHRKTIERYSLKGQNIYYEVVRNRDFSAYKCSTEEVLKIINWVVRGLSAEYIDYILENDS